MADAGRSRRARTKTMADGGAGRCLSDLSDDLLRHILFLAPDREGWLWRTSGAVHVDSRSFCSTRAHRSLAFLRDHDKKALAEQERDAFFRGAEKAIAAATAYGRIRRLTFFIAEDSEIILLTRWWSKEHNLIEHNLMEALVSNPAAWRVEELQILVRALNTRFRLSFFGSLPFEALRVLRIVGCDTLTAGAATRAFPMLEELHLKSCSVPLVDLQRIIHAAPLLSKLHLASSRLSQKSSSDAMQLVLVLVGRLVIPAVSVLELAGCTYEHRRLELEVPRLQFFRYRGPVDHSDHLSLKSQASYLDVELQLTHGTGHCFTEVETTTRESFWRFLQNFSTTKRLKLRMDCFAMGGLAFTDKASRDQLLGGFSFSLLEQLELEAEYHTGFEPLLANFLHCCPMVRDLRIKLIKKDTSPWVQSSIGNNPARAQFDKSVSGFRNRRSRTMVSLGPKNEDKHQEYDVSSLA